MVLSFSAYAGFMLLLLTNFAFGLIHVGHGDKCYQKLSTCDDPWSCNSGVIGICLADNGSLADGQQCFGHTECAGQKCFNLYAGNRINGMCVSGDMQYLNGYCNTSNRPCIQGVCTSFAPDRSVCKPVPLGQACTSYAVCDSTIDCNKTCGGVNARCSNDAGCASSHCISSRFMCGNPRQGLGGACALGDDCTAGKCGSGICGGLKSTCSTDSDCSGSKCGSGTCGGLKSVCSKDTECSGSKCGSGTCGGLSSSCSKDTECSASKCGTGVCGGLKALCAKDVDCSSSHCSTVSKLCAYARNSIRSLCATNDDCIAPLDCGNGTCGGLAAACNTTDNLCASQFCVQSKCATPPAAGSVALGGRCKFFTDCKGAAKTPQLTRVICTVSGICVNKFH